MSWLDRLICRLFGHSWETAQNVECGAGGIWRPYVSCRRCDARQEENAS